MRGARRRRALLACALLLAAGWVGAQRLTLVPVGEAADALAAALGEAVAAWEAAYGETLEVAVAPGADPAGLEGPVATVLRGDPALLGPDVASLTLIESGRPSEVRLAPGWLDEPRPLLHEIGLLLGAPSVDSGVMAPEIAGDAAARLEAPEPSDVAALRAALRFPAEDLTRDGVVDFYDLLELAESFGAQGFLPADLNEDGIVDREDLARLQRAYTFTAPSPEPPAGEVDEAPEDEALPDGEAPTEAEPEPEAEPGAGEGAVPEAAPADPDAPGDAPDAAPEDPGAPNGGSSGGDAAPGEDAPADEPGDASPGSAPDETVPGEPAPPGDGG